MSLKTWGLVALYLGAIVAANLIVNHNGPWITPYVAFALIGADLTVRDGLHDRWGDDGGLWVRMLALIGAGGLISYLLNQGAGKIALASVVAFLAAGLVDLIVYHLLHGADRDTRVNGSNIVAALVDSVLFLWIAFGVVNGITFAQFVAKVAGGVVWLLAFKIVGQVRMTRERRGAVLARHA